MPRRLGQHIFLRLLDIPAKGRSTEELMNEVKHAIEQFGGFEWLAPLSIHPAGGICVHIRPLTEPDFAALAIHLEEAGFHNVV